MKRWTKLGSLVVAGTFSMTQAVPSAYAAWNLRPQATQATSARDQLASELLNPRIQAALERHRQLVTAEQDTTYEIANLGEYVKEGQVPADVLQAVERGLIQAFEQGTIKDFEMIEPSESAPLRLRVKYDAPQPSAEVSRLIVDVVSQAVEPSQPDAAPTSAFARLTAPEQDWLIFITRDVTKNVEKVRDVLAQVFLGESTQGYGVEQLVQRFRVLRSVAKDLVRKATEPIAMAGSAYARLSDGERAWIDHISGGERDEVRDILAGYRLGEVSPGEARKRLDDLDITDDLVEQYLEAASQPIAMAGSAYARIPQEVRELIDPLSGNAEIRETLAQVYLGELDREPAITRLTQLATARRIDPSLAPRLAQDSVELVVGQATPTPTTLPEDAGKTFMAVTAPGNDKMAFEQRGKFDQLVRATIAGAFANGQALRVGPPPVPLLDQQTDDLGLIARIDAASQHLSRAAERAGVAEQFAKRRTVFLIDDENPALYEEGNVHLIGSSGNFPVAENPQGSHYVKLALVELAPQVLGRDEASRFLEVWVRHETAVLNARMYVIPSEEDERILNDGFAKIRQRWLVQTGRAAEVREDVAQQFPELFGDKVINGRTVNVEQTIAELTHELSPEIAQALTARRKLLESKAPVREKYAFPKWDEIFTDVHGSVRSFRDIMQGLRDNFLGRDTELAWRLNDEVPIPDEAHPLKNPGLELTGPWHPLDMAIKQINADVAATMGPDDEDAAPPHYVPEGALADQAVGLYASRDNERRLLAGEVNEVTMTKKGRRVTYRIEKPLGERPTSFHRVPSFHLLDQYVTVNGKPAPAIIVDEVIHALNDFGSLKKIGKHLYDYLPKIQHPREALIVAKLLWRSEQLMGATKPGQFIKVKMLYEEGRAGLYLPVIMWILRPWLIGTNVGRWDDTGSLIEMWKDERVLPDPQNGPLMGMISPHMMGYQRYNALLNVMAGMKNGKLTNAAPIGGMAAVMLYPATDPYGRHRHNPITLRAMKNDKLRERLIGQMVLVDEPPPPGQQVTLADVLGGRVKGMFADPIDAYRQSWVASPDKDYVAAGNAPLRMKVEELQAMLDALEVWEEQDGQRVAPTVPSGLTTDERKQLASLGLLNDAGQITPWVLPKAAFETPEAFFSSKELWGGKDLWDSLYDIPEGEVTIENVQHAFYMDAQYGFQILNGNLAAAIDDYVLFPKRSVRFMNDLATYRIFVGWPWTALRLGGRITKGGWLKKPKLTEDGVIPGENAIELKAGTVITPEIFEQLWQLHMEWTDAFFKEQDRLAAIRLVAATMVDRYTREDESREREDIILYVVQAVVTSMIKRLSSEATAARVAEVLGVEPSIILGEVFRQVTLMTPVLSHAYGQGPTYTRELSYQEAAAQVAELLGVEAATVEAEIEAAAPRFDRTKALVIMDVLKRQLLSSRYLQHSPRVLFAIADKRPEERRYILNAIYYVDEHSTPLFRDDAGQPSRAELVEAVASGALPRYALEAHDHVYDIFPEEVEGAAPASPPTPPVPAVGSPVGFTTVTDENQDEIAQQVAELEARWKEEEEQYGIRRDYTWEDLKPFLPPNLPEDQLPKSMAEAVVRMRGALFERGSDKMAAANAELFRKIIFSNDPEEFVFGVGAYAPQQAQQILDANYSRKGQGKGHKPRLAIYGSGWVLAATHNVDGLILPDQQLYSAPATQIAAAQAITNAAERTAANSALEGDARMLEDWLPLYVMDMEAPLSAMHAFNMTAQAIKAGVGIFHYERQDPGHKVCGHGGGACSRTSTSHNAVLKAARLAGDVLNVPVVIMGRTDAAHEKFLVADDPLDRDFILGHTSDGQEMSYAEAVKAGFAGEWTDREINAGPSGYWTPDRTEERLFRVRPGVERIVHDLVVMAPYSDIMWSDTHSISYEERVQVAEGVHAVYPGKPLADNVSPNLPFTKLTPEEVEQFRRELPTLGYKYLFMTLASYRNVAYNTFMLSLDIAERGGWAALIDLQRKEQEAASLGYRGHQSQVMASGRYYDYVKGMTGAPPEMAFVAGSTEAMQAGLASPYALLEHRDRVLLDEVIRDALFQLEPSVREAARPEVADFLAALYRTEQGKPGTPATVSATVETLVDRGISELTAQLIAEQVVGTARTGHQVSVEYAGLTQADRDKIDPVIKRAEQILFPDGQVNPQVRAQLQGILTRIYRDPFDLTNRYEQSLVNLELPKPVAYELFNEASQAGWTGPYQQVVIFAPLTVEQVWPLFPVATEAEFTLEVQHLGRGPFEPVAPDRRFVTDDIVRLVPKATSDVPQPSPPPAVIISDPALTPESIREAMTGLTLHQVIAFTEEVVRELGEQTLRDIAQHTGLFLQAPVPNYPLAFIRHVGPGAAVPEDVGVTALRHPDPTRRKEAVKTLGGLILRATDTSEARRAFNRLVNVWHEDPEPRVRHTAFEELTRIAQQSQQESLRLSNEVKRINDALSQEGVREADRQALEQIRASLEEHRKFLDDVARDTAQPAGGALLASLSYLQKVEALGISTKEIASLRQGLWVKQFGHALTYTISEDVVKQAANLDTPRWVVIHSSVFVDGPDAAIALERITRQLKTVLEDGESALHVALVVEEAKTQEEAEAIAARLFAALPQASAETTRLTREAFRLVLPRTSDVSQLVSQLQGEVPEATVGSVVGPTGWAQEVQHATSSPDTVAVVAFQSTQQDGKAARGGEAMIAGVEAAATGGTLNPTVAATLELPEEAGLIAPTDVLPEVEVAVRSYQATIRAALERA